MDKCDPVFALVDYDNIRSNDSERVYKDVLENMSDIIDRLVSHIKVNMYSDELLIRFYGGWLNEEGKYTQRGEWMLRAAKECRGRRSGILAKPTIAVSLAALPEHHLKGMYRKRRNNDGKAGQKMVDTALCADAIFFAISSRVVIASDDDDVMIGGLAAAVQKKRRAHLLRRRKSGLNDNICDTVELGLFVME